MTMTPRTQIGREAVEAAIRETKPRAEFQWGPEDGDKNLRHHLKVRVEGRIIFDDMTFARRDLDTDGGAPAVLHAKFYRDIGVVIAMADSRHPSLPFVVLCELSNVSEDAEDPPRYVVGYVDAKRRGWETGGYHKILDAAKAEFESRQHRAP